MPIINALPNTITNGQLVDAVPVMANFNWLVSQVNGNACPATIGSGVLKGNGAGGTSTAVAGTDYAGIGSVNVFTALQSGIAAVAAANFPIASQVQQSAFNTGASGGTADAITVTFTPTITSLASAPIWWRATAANATTTPTLKRDGLTAKTLVKGANQALVAGDIPGAGAWMCSQYDAGLDKEVLLNPAVASTLSGTISSGTTATTQLANDNSTKVATTAYVETQIPATLNATGTAPVYAARAWARFNGTTVGTNPPTAGGNVTSITRNGTGDYTVNLTTAMPDANYHISVSAAEVIARVADDVTPRTTTAFRVRVQNSSFTLTDNAFMSVAVFR